MEEWAGQMQQGGGGGVKGQGGGQDDGQHGRSSIGPMGVGMAYNRERPQVVSFGESLWFVRGGGGGALLVSTWEVREAGAIFGLALED